MLPLEQQVKAVAARPKRRATNAHIFRYLQHGNPDRLQVRDLKRALEASLEECSDLWPAEDTASCSSSDQSNASSSTGLAHLSPKQRATGGSAGGRRLANSIGPHSRRTSQLSDTQSIECTCSTSAAPIAASYLQQCPVHGHRRPKVHKRYKPVVKKNIYYEADFFHEGIMEYISFELDKFSVLGDPDYWKLIRELAADGSAANK